MSAVHASEQGPRLWVHGSALAGVDVREVHVQERISSLFEANVVAHSFEHRLDDPGLVVVRPRALSP